MLQLQEKVGILRLMYHLKEKSCNCWIIALVRLMLQMKVFAIIRKTLESEICYYCKKKVTIIIKMILAGISCNFKTNTTIIRKML